MKEKETIEQDREVAQLNSHILTVENWSWKKKAIKTCKWEFFT